MRGHPELAWVTYALAVLATTAIAYGCAVLVERPGIRIGHRWSDAILWRKETPPTAVAGPVVVPEPRWSPGCNRRHSGWVALRPPWGALQAIRYVSLP